VVFDVATLHLAVGTDVHVFSEVSPFPEQDTRGDPSRAVAPVAGRVAHVSVAVGETVGEGHALVCVEAMKMEMWLHAQAGGRVSAVHVKVGDQVELNTLLVELELAGSDDNDSNNQET